MRVIYGVGLRFAFLHHRVILQWSPPHLLDATIGIRSPCESISSFCIIASTHLRERSHTIHAQTNIDGTSAVATRCHLRFFSKWSVSICFNPGHFGTDEMILSTRASQPSVPRISPLASKSTSRKRDLSVENKWMLVSMGFTSTRMPYVTA